jgi:thymidylate synthase (FAD)
MNIELKGVTSGVCEDNLTPDEMVAMAARGDHQQDSMVGASFEEAMEGTEKNHEELIEQLLRRGHFGPFEHVQMFFAVENISRVAMAQVTRHRHMSFDVRSMRYTDSSDMEAVIPPTAEENKTDGEKCSIIMKSHSRESKERYQTLVEAGVPEEDARMVFPLMTGVHMTFSANMRSLMHFFDLRKNAKAQWEAREFAQKVLEEVKEVAPLTFHGYEKHINNNSLRAP